jgi:DNA integrity scanning protein DisA with diadenylate cyclase activity
MNIVEHILLAVNWMSASLIAIFLIKYMANIDSKPIINLFIANVIFIGLRALNRQIEVDNLLPIYNSSIGSSILSLGIALYFCYWLHDNYGKKIIKQNGNIKNKIQDNSGGNRGPRIAEG